MDEEKEEEKGRIRREMNNKIAKVENNGASSIKTDNVKDSHGTFSRVNTIQSPSRFTSNVFKQPLPGVTLQHTDARNDVRNRAKALVCQDSCLLPQFLQ